MRNLLELRSVEKRYDNGTLALQGVDLSIGEHQFVSFLGPSGCGKSTALRMIAGLSAVTAGQIAWSDALTDHAQDISFVFQEPTLMPWARVFDNVWLPLRLKGVSRHFAKSQVDGVLAKVGLEQFATVFPRELSGGMKMRVSIARAMVTHGGSPWWWLKLIGDPARRLFGRGLRALMARDCKTTWLQLHSMNNVRPADCANFIQRVRGTLEKMQ